MKKVETIEEAKKLLIPYKEKLENMEGVKEVTLRCGEYNFCLWFYIEDHRGEMSGKYHTSYLGKKLGIGFTVDDGGRYPTRCKDFDRAIKELMEMPDNFLSRIENGKKADAENKIKLETAKKFLEGKISRARKTYSDDCTHYEVCIEENPKEDDNYFESISVKFNFSDNFKTVESVRERSVDVDLLPDEFFKILEIYKAAYKRQLPA